MIISEPQYEVDTLNCMQSIANVERYFEGGRGSLHVQCSQKNEIQQWGAKFRHWVSGKIGQGPFPHCEKMSKTVVNIGFTQL